RLALPVVARGAMLDSSSSPLPTTTPGSSAPAPTATSPTPRPTPAPVGLPAGRTSRISLGAAGAQTNGNSNSPAITPDGRYVVFCSGEENLVPAATNGTTDVFVKDLQTGAVERVSVANGGVQSVDRSDTPVISADGRYVAFRTLARDLLPNKTTNYGDIVLR